MGLEITQYVLLLFQYTTNTCDIVTSQDFKHIKLSSWVRKQQHRFENLFNVYGTAAAEPHNIIVNDTVSIFSIC